MGKLISFLIGGVLGVIAGAGAMLVVYPFVFPPPEVNESVSQNEAQELVLETAFREGVSGQDGGHWGRGDVKIYQDDNGDYLLELQSNFEVGAGPNFWLYLNGISEIDDEDAFLGDAERVKLIKLKSFKGSQVYRITAADYEKGKSVTIWCETFNQYIASANLL